MMLSVLFFLAQFTARVAGEKVFTHGTDMYCGDENCYDVLGITREATKRELKKAFRRMSVKYHPDKNLGAKEEAAAKFLVINNAHEILSDAEGRKGYNEALDNPDEFLNNQYNWYRYKYAPKSDARFVIALVIGCISGLQYFVQTKRHAEAIAFYKKRPEVVKQAQRLALERWRESKSDSDAGASASPKKKKKKKKNKKGPSQDEVAAVLEELGAGVKIRGGYAEADVKSTCAGYMFYHLPLYVIWRVKWVYKFNIMRQPFGPEELRYKTYSAMGIRCEKFECEYTPEQQEAYIARVLWLPKNLAVYTAEQAAMKAKQAQEAAKEPRSYRQWKKRKNAKALHEQDGAW